MSPKIHSSFWCDEDVENLDSEAKLVLLWLITNSNTTVLGLCQVPSNKRFQLETGLPTEGLQRALKGLSRSVQQFGSTLFIRGYVRHQFGVGVKLRTNNIFKAIRSHFESIRDENLKTAVLKEYPEFEQGLQSPSEGFKGVRERTREGECTGEGKQIGGAGGKSIEVALPDNEKEAAEWCAAAGVPPAFAIDVFHQCVGRGWVDGAGQNITSFSSYAKRRFMQSQSNPRLQTSTPNGKPDHRAEKAAREYPETIKPKVLK
jgi:hypothetical protein